ncbi:uncharacterized protein V1510DRAFT_418976 [Dipodascopsis tothii]|uniref:uncharacterized protein n=1 Tax=Dipodascopsis tothii TaxID=44089 RepID=UPI0034CF5481
MRPPTPPFAAVEVCFRSRRNPQKATDMAASDEQPATPAPFTAKKNQMYPDDPTDKKHMAAMNAKEPGKFYDPCAMTSKLSLRCLERHNYDRAAAKEPCAEYYQAYKECKKEWMDQMRRERAW